MASSLTSLKKDEIRTIYEEEEAKEVSCSEVDFHESSSKFEEVDD